MSCSNSPMSFLDEDKFNSERLLALKYISERVERASTVQNILAPITPQEEYIFDVARVDDAASEISELSDPFAELGGNIVLSAENKQKRRLSKVEADVLVMNSFPSSHMEVQNEIAAEMGLLQPPPLDIEKIMESKADDETDDESDSFNQIACALQQIGLKGYKDKKKKSTEGDKSRQKPKKTKSQEEDADANSFLSGIWRMLDATSIDDGFPITQTGYNFYEDKKTLVNPAEKTWNQKEEVRKKCESWLKDVK